MKEKGTSLVVFVPNDDAEKYFGILMSDNSILCLCCGEFFEEGNYKLIKNYNGFDYVDDTLKEFFDSSIFDESIED